jgi:phosphoribosylaminoimidazolecarboxamide formyltransferase/IMP cyclohydrolase
LLANIALKYAQSNNICYSRKGQVIGLAAGQQNRVESVVLAGKKAFRWFQLRSKPILDLKKSLAGRTELKRQDVINLLIDEINTIPAGTEAADTEVSLASDAFFPFRDSIDVAASSGVKYIIQPGGSLADQSCIDACNKHGISMVLTGKRMFHH